MSKSQYQSPAQTKRTEPSAPSATAVAEPEAPQVSESKPVAPSGCRFRRVRAPFFLNWPNGYPEPRHRGKAGYVIDTHNELEAAWCAGQEHKFEDAPDATEASPITSGKAKGEMGTLEAKRNPPPQKPQYTNPVQAAKS